MTRDPNTRPAPERAAEALSAMRPADVPAPLYRRALDAVPPEPDPSETASIVWTTKEEPQWP